MLKQSTSTIRNRPEGHDRSLGLKHHVLAATEEALIKADAAWVAKLLEAFGAHQVNAMAAKPDGVGEPGTELRKAYEARQSALRDWRATRDLD